VRNRAEGSGSAVAIAGLAEGLRLLDHSVTFLHPRVVFPSRDFTRLWYNLTLRPRVASVVGEFDVIVGFDYDGWALNRIPGCRFVVALKGVAADERRFETGWARTKFGLWSYLEKKNAASADRVFVTSEYSKQKVLESYGLRNDLVRIAPEAIGPDIAAHGSGESKRVRSKKPPTILSVARQYRRKDSATLIRAIPGLVAAIPDIRVRIVGDGPELAKTRRLAARLGVVDRVSFLSSLDTVDALRTEYERASVFCLPSLQEGFGIVFLEAMSHGLPIVAATTGAVPEVAPHGETSLLVPPGDPASLTHALIRVLTDSNLAGQLGSAGIQRASKYDWSTAARAFLAGLEG
jgi:glycosyltransferase involved in cell wall biosynthesis